MAIGSPAGARLTRVALWPFDLSVTSRPASTGCAAGWCSSRSCSGRRRVVAVAQWWRRCDAGCHRADADGIGDPHRVTIDEPGAVEDEEAEGRPPAPCEDSAIEVTVAADAETYPADRQPSFTFAVENVSDEACSREVGQAANELRVTSGGTQVWSSDDCSPGGEDDPTNLDPGDRFVQTVSWPKVQSAEGCPTPQEAATAGSYQVVARNLEVLSEPAVFVLE